MNFEVERNTEQYTEILKLKDMLKKEKIPFQLRPLYDGWQVGYPKALKECFVCSAIQRTCAKIKKRRARECNLSIFV